MTPPRPLNQEPDPLESHPSATPARTSDIHVRTGDSETTTLVVASALTAHGFRVEAWDVADERVDLLLVTFSAAAPLTDATRSALHAQTPILFVGPPPELPTPLLHDAIDHLDASASTADTLMRAHALLARRGHLHLLITQVDSPATLLALTPDIEWVRSRTAIVGLVRLTSQTSASELRPALDIATARAHSALDELSVNALASDDLWNLLLLVSLPWTKEEAMIDPSLMAILIELEHDVRGSRKACLWRGVSPLAHIAAFHAAAATWLPTSPDPLRDELLRQAANPAEREALLALFRRRLLESDINRIIDVLKLDSRQ